MVYLGMALPIFYSLDMRLPDQIKEREKENPDQVDQGPVQGHHFDGGEIGTGKFDLEGTDQGEGHQAHADEDVKPMQTRHHEIEPVKDMHEGIMETFPVPQAAGQGPMMDLQR